MIWRYARLALRLRTARYAHENEMLGGFEIVWHFAELLTVPKTGKRDKDYRGPLCMRICMKHILYRNLSLEGGYPLSYFGGHLFILVRSCDTVGTYPLSYMLDLIHLCGSAACDPDLSITGGNRCKCLRI